jgi:Holliday junction resolvase RusA-like endonuclease
VNFREIDSSGRTCLDHRERFLSIEVIIRIPKKNKMIKRRKRLLCGIITITKDNITVRFKALFDSLNHTLLLNDSEEFEMRLVSKWVVFVKQTMPLL